MSSGDGASIFILDRLKRFNKIAPLFIWLSGDGQDYTYEIPVKWLMYPIDKQEQTYQIEWGPQHGSSIHRKDLNSCLDWLCKIRGSDGVEIRPKIFKILAFNGRNLTAEFNESPDGIRLKSALSLRKKKATKISLEVVFSVEEGSLEQQLKRTFMLSSD